MPIRPKYGSPGLTADRETRAREAALVESGRDPFAEALQALIPINVATQAGQEHGRLGGLASLASSTIMGRGGMGAAPWLTRMARRIGRPGQTDDLVQAAHEAVLKEGGELNPRAAMRAAKSAMLNMQSAGGTGARSQTAAAIAKAQNRIGEGAGEFRLWSETNKNLAKPITLERFRQARAQTSLRGHQRPISLERQMYGKGDVTLADTLAGGDNPVARAILREGIRKLTPQQQTNILKQLRGEDVNPAILQRLKLKLRGGKDPELPPISGGSAPSVADELSAQVRAGLRQTDPTWVDQIKKGQSGMGGYGGPRNPRTGVVNPEHADFIALQQGDPRVARALDRSPVGQGFATIPHAQWGPGQMGVTAPRGLGVEESGVPILESLMGGPAGAKILQGINPGIPVPGLRRQTRLHEGLHALLYGKQAATGQALTGTVDPKHAFKIALHMARRGHRPFEAIAEDYPHRAVDAMAWNIRRKTP